MLLKHRSLFLLFFFLFGCATQIFGQDRSASDGSTPAALAKGAAPLGAYGGGNFDRINLYNGNLAFAFPLAGYSGRAGLGGSVMLSYNSKFWRLVQNQQGLYTPLDDDYDFHTPGIAPGWVLNTGRMVRRSIGIGSSSCTLPEPAPFIAAQTLTRFTFITPDGTEYEFRDRKFNGQPQPSPFCGLPAPPQLGANRGRVFVTSDGTAATFISNQDVFDKVGQSPVSVLSYPPDDSPFPTGTVYLRDGTRFIVVEGLVKKQIDRHGNVVQYEHNSARKLTQVKDSLGRQINLSYAYTEQEAFDITVSYSGFGGAARSIVIRGRRLETAYVGGGSLPPSSQLFPNYNDAASGGVYNPVVVTEMELVPSGYKWKFGYNAYGEVARVENPGTGVVTYQMAFGENQFLPNNEFQIFRRVTERHVFPTQNGGEEGFTRYSDPTATSAVTTTDPLVAGKGVFVNEERFTPNQTLLAKTTCLFQGSPLDNFTNPNPDGNFLNYRPWKQGKELKMMVYDVVNGAASTQPERTTITEWDQNPPGWWTGEAIKAPENNPKLKKKFITLENGKTARTEFQYDLYNNVTNEKSYGFDGVLLTEVNRTYVDSLNGINYRTVPEDVNLGDIGLTVVHLRSLADTESVSGPNPVTGQSETVTSTFEYDNYQPDGGGFHAGLIDYGFAPADLTRDNQRGGGWKFRGNLTSMTAGGIATSYTLYDIVGNPVKSFGPPNASQQRKTVAMSYAPGNSYAYPTQMETALNGVPNNKLVSTTAYDFATGLVTGTVGANGETISFQYNDPLDRVSQVTRPSGMGFSTYSYSSNGQLPTVTVNGFWNGKTTSATLKYDGMMKPIEQRGTDPNGVGEVTTLNRYDAMGRLVKTSDAFRSAADSGWTHTTYDGLSRVIRAAHYADEFAASGYSGQVLSDYIENEVTVTDQAGNQRRSVNDALGRVTSVWEANGATVTPSVETQYKYDARGNLTKVIQGNRVREFTYDNLNRVILSQVPESGLTQLFYDAASNLTKRIDNRQTKAEYTYDEIRRVKTVTYTAGTQTAPTGNITYFYDQNVPPGAPTGNGYTAGATLGKLTGIATAEVRDPQNPNIIIQAATTVGYGYEASNTAGRMVQRWQAVGHNGTTYTHLDKLTLNEAGLPIQETYPSGVKLEADYTAGVGVEQIRRVGTSTIILAQGFEYQPTGQLKQQRLGNGLYQAYGYNSRDQVTSISLGTTANGADKLSITYDYGTTNNNGNVREQRITPTTGAQPWVQTYQYDTLDRLKVAAESLNGTQTWMQTYAYDPYGNRTNVGGTLGTQGLTFGTNNRITTSDYLYDNAGNLTADPSGKTYLYDAENRLVLATANGVTSRYHYDGEGHRVKADVDLTNPAVTRFVYGVGGGLIAEYTGTNTTPAKEYAYGATGMLAEMERVCSTGTPKVALKYTTADMLGSPRVVTNQRGDIISRHDYLPFGEEIAPALGNRNGVAGYALPDGIRQKFTGYERDQETGLDFAQARHFASTMGRFMSVDPLGASGKIGNPQTWNRYTYCLNNPLGRVDRTGMDSSPTDDGDYDGSLAAANKKESQDALLNEARWAAYEKRSAEMGDADSSEPQNGQTSQGQSNVPYGPFTIPFVVDNIEELEKRVNEGTVQYLEPGTNRAQCARLPQCWQSAQDGGYKESRRKTDFWGMGPDIFPGMSLKKGTVLGTFDRVNRIYPKEENHTVIFLGWEKKGNVNGMWVIEQMRDVNGRPRINYIPFLNHNRDYWKNANRFNVVMIETDPPGSAKSNRR